MGRVLGALLVLCALSGCVAVTEPPPSGFTDADEIAYARDNVDLMWANSQLADQRPDGLVVQVVSEETWGANFVGCLAEAGYSGYTSVGFGGFAYDHNPDEAEQVAQLVCASQWQMRPREGGRLNDAELGYLYDYYRETLVPCYELAGIDVAGAPTRAEFITSGGDWAPYAVVRDDGLTSFERGSSPWFRSTPGNDLYARCPSFPPEWDVEYTRDG